MSNKIANRKFFINVLTLVSGTAISQGVTLTVMPLLTRIYTPQEFGNFALYLAIVSTISVVSSWKYELAIMLPKKDKDAQALLFISIVITVLMSVLILLILIIFNKQLTVLFDNLRLFIWMIPVGIFFTGIVQVFSAWNTRNQFYKNVSGARITQAGSTAISQFSFRYYSGISKGLIWGSIIGFILSLAVLIYRSIKMNTIHLKTLSKENIIKNAKDYKNFPKYQSFSVLINSFSQHLPVMLLTIFYSPVIAGFYSLTHRALNTPARLIGGSVRQVFYENASKIYSSGNSIKKIYEKVTFNLIKVTILPYLVLGIFSKEIFSFIFGVDWITSGIYAQFIIFFIFTITINPPSVMSIQILGMQRFHLKYEFLLAFARAASIYIGFAYFSNHFISIGLFAAVGLLFNVFLILYVYNKIKQDTLLRE